ncbi:hypothetical protein KC364_g89 [Hortaea werneckii]|nr:hypothetical protein KC364_g89 [Hortaea werneckii]
MTNIPRPKTPNDRDGNDQHKDIGRDVEHAFNTAGTDQYPLNGRQALKYVISVATHPHATYTATALIHRSCFNPDVRTSEFGIVSA